MRPEWHFLWRRARPQRPADLSGLHAKNRWDIHIWSIYLFLTKNVQIGMIWPKIIAGEELNSKNSLTES